MKVSGGFVKKIKRHLKAFARDTEVKVNAKAVGVPVV